ncbi:hypothetical protein R1sor_005644 [Riccia sorocarpa]|uniref:Transcription factor CBF/NF-Y/archaeal histone domain-containing protein n=1 Tax=Riccia sorocarpa TaxID=122646 RepID=A0ABD3HKS7_9MARC
MHNVFHFEPIITDSHQEREYERLSSPVETDWQTAKIGSSNHHCTSDVMDIDRGVPDGEETASHERTSSEIAKQAETEEAGPVLSVDADAAVGDALRTENPSGQSSLQPVREKRKPKSSEDEAPPVLPFTIVKRIVKLDPDIRLVSKEGIFVIGQATKHFLEALAAESISQAWKNKRKGVKADDIIVAGRNTKFRDCLGSAVSDFVQYLREDSEDEDAGEGEMEEGGAAASKKGNKKEAKKKKCLQPPPGNRSIMDFLKASS